MKRLALVSMMALLPIGAARAGPPPIPPGVALTMPTPAAPKLKLPSVEPLTPSLMLQHVRPLQMPRSAPRRTLNGFPGVAPGPSEDADGAVPDDEGERRLYLQHRR